MKLYLDSDRSHAPAWECLRRRSASRNRAAGAAKAAFPRRAWERSKMAALPGKSRG